MTSPLIRDEGTISYPKPLYCIGLQSYKSRSYLILERHLCAGGGRLRERRLGREWQKRLALDLADGDQD